MVRSPFILKQFLRIVLSMTGILMGSQGINCFIQESSYGHTDSSFYTVENVSVDVMDDTVLVARDKALSESQKRALSILLERLSGRPLSFWESTLNSLTEAEISNLVADFETTHEKSSSTRYKATLTYRFKKNDVDAFLSQKGLTPLEIIKEPVLIIPILKIEDKAYLWEDENLWRRLWQEGSLPFSELPLLTPLGDLEDMQALDISQALTEDHKALEALSERYKATGGALVVIASLPEPSSSSDDTSHPVTITVLGSLVSPPGSLNPPPLTPLPQETMSSLLDKALKEIINSLNMFWKQGILKGSFKKEALFCKVPLYSPHDWFSIRTHLENLKKNHIISDFSVEKLRSQDVSLHLSFRGDPTSLSTSFQKENLDLIQKDGGWVLLQKNHNDQAFPPLSSPSF